MASSFGKQGEVRLGRSADRITFSDVYSSIIEGKKILVVPPYVPRLCVVSANMGRFFDVLASDVEGAVVDMLSRRTSADGLSE